MSMQSRIDSLEFGRIRIGGKTYTTDVLIFPDGRVQDQWWRQRGHRLCGEDLAQLLTANPDEIVVGTGIHGRLHPVGSLVADLESQGVRLSLMPNVEARSHYHQLMDKGAEAFRLAACFHLTC